MTLLGNSQEPTVSVLMSVYNGERYLVEAIESILTQSYTDFEFLIIDDGSIDSTPKILADYAVKDPRVRVVPNDINIGLARCLNKGIKLARGKYIARMDCDDISLPERLAKQVNYLDSNQNCAVLAVKISMIDVFGNNHSLWKEDQRTTTWGEIYQQMPKANCIAHPGIMIRKSVLSTYMYNNKHSFGQDYELWLRICADGLRIEKLDEVLLRYRINPLSITAKSNKSRSGMKNVLTKTYFLRDWILHKTPNTFVFKVLYYLLKDLLHFLIVDAVTIIDRILICFGKIIGGLLPFKNRSGIFFFFSFYHTGGAEKVHSDIVSCFKKDQPWVFFTLRSNNNHFRPTFRESAKLFNICYLPILTRSVIIGILSVLINRHKKAVVFGCNSYLYYKLIPHLNNQVRRIDLIHAFGGGAEHFSLEVASEIDTRVVINEKTIDDFKAQYSANGLDISLSDRVMLIENRMIIPEKYPDKKISPSLKIIYVGRGSEEKRVHLFGRVATLCKQHNLPTEFILIGDVAAALDIDDLKNCNVMGVITDTLQLNKIYAEADLLLLLSSREGFPLVIMEAMAHGVVPVCTNVGGIQVHVKHQVNGMLVANNDEGAIVANVFEIIENMHHNRALLQQLSRSSYDYAKQNFSSPRFCKAYRKLILGDQACDNNNRHSAETDI